MSSYVLVFMLPIIVSLIAKKDTSCMVGDTYIGDGGGDYCLSHLLPPFLRKDKRE